MADKATPTRLGLADDADAAVVDAPWIGALVALGASMRRYLMTLEGRQLVLALSVPRRDYVSALIASGWMLTSEPPQLELPIEVFRAATRDTPMRAVTDNLVIAGRYVQLDEDRVRPRVLVAGQTREVERYRAVSVLEAPVENVHAPMPQPGFLGKMARAADTWPDRMACPPADLALIGTALWLEADLDACISNAGPSQEPSCPLRNYVLPEGKNAATWATRVYPASRLAEQLPLPSRYLAAILDGAGAVKYLSDITAPIVVCVIDRSVADETAAEVVMQARSANSRPIALRETLRWSPPAGIEALAFTVAL